MAPAPLPGPAERVFNLLAGLTCLSLGAQGLSRDPELSVVRACLTSLHLLAAWLFLRRGALRTAADTRGILQSLPAFAAAIWAYQHAPPPPRWPGFAAALFVGGTAWTLASLGTLGRSFAVLPALRTVVTRGPYRVVRHPAYLGELVLLLACVLARPSGSGALVAAFGVGFFVLRIRAEERLLATSPAYSAYMQDVRYRLVPGVW